MPEKISLGTKTQTAVLSWYLHQPRLGRCIPYSWERQVRSCYASPLIQDGRVEANKCLGIKTRWILGELSSNRTREIVYSLTDETTGISEVLAVDSSRYLVLERDSNVGASHLLKNILGRSNGSDRCLEYRVFVIPRSSTIKEVQKKEFIDC